MKVLERSTDVIYSSPMAFCAQEQPVPCTFQSDTFLCLHSRNGEDQVAQMGSRNADRGLGKRKLKITEQLKENK